MGAIKDAFASVWRDFSTAGVISSGKYEPRKVDIRAVGPIIEQAIANAGMGALLDVSYSTKVEIDADLAPDAGAVGLVFADPADANNDLYLKTGASGAPGWVNTGAVHSIIGTLAGPFVTDAEAAALSANNALAGVEASGAGLIAATVAPLRARLARLLGASGAGRLDTLVAGFEEFAPTPNGCQPYLIAGADGYFWRGTVYADEASLLAATGGVADADSTDWGYVSDEINLLGPVDFAVDEQGFVLTKNCTADAVGGVLRVVITAAGSNVARYLVGYGGRCLVYSGKGRKDTQRLIPAVSPLNQLAGGVIVGATITNTAFQNFALMFSPNTGRQMWIGAKNDTDPAGAYELDDLSLKEAWPMLGFPNGNFTLRRRLTAPNPLPGADLQLAEGNTGPGNSSARWRVTLKPTGVISMSRTFYVGTGVQDSQSVDIGAVVAGADFTLAVAFTATRLTGAVDGAGASLDVVGAAGVGYLTLDRTTGADLAFYVGAETLDGCRRLSAPATAIPFTSKQQLVIVMNGDSYSASAQYGVGLYLEDLGYTLINLGKGGAEMLAALATRAARTDLNGLPNTVEIFWDGAANEAVPTTVQDKKDAIDAWVAALGHDRWAYVRSAQMPSASAQEYSDSTEIFDWVRDTYGLAHVIDPQVTIAQLSTGSVGDIADLDAGRFPGSAMALADPGHLGSKALRLTASQDFAPRIEELWAS